MPALIATDGSEAALRAASAAAGLLRKDIEFVVVTVAPPPVDPEEDAGGFEGPLLTPEEAEAMSRAALVEANAALAATAEVLGAVPVEQRVVEGGSAGEAICSLAAELKAEVVVVGRHGKSYLAEVLLGSVSRYLIHHCECPVLVVPAPHKKG